jgi:hypothetical protein
MALPAWPDTVPYKVVLGWSMSQMYIAPVATDMDGGNQRLRPKPGSNVAVVDYPLRPLTAAQWSDLDTFIRATLNNGASRFTMPVFTGNDYVSKTVQFDQGKSPSVTRASNRMTVSLPLRIFGM